MTPRNCFSRPARIVATWLAMLSFGATSAHAFIGEPETLVFGRILNRTNPNLDHVVTEGALHWTIRKPDGSVIVLKGDVDALDGGNYSYLVRIPHQAMMLGQQATPNLVPLATVAAKASHMSITLNGEAATILPSATSVLDLDQLLRASALRVDLEIKAPEADQDGDGMADWWEDANGLDKQNTGDALTDLNGNGINNLAEYKAGKDPKRDSKLPLLVTKEVVAYAQSKSIVLLETADSDSTPAQLIYTLYSTPENGRLLLRNAAMLPAETSRELSAGATFTQADVLAGRLIFEQTAAEAPGAFNVGVRDENATHPESRGLVLPRMFAPDDTIVAASAAESVRLEALRLARDHGHLVADLGATAGNHQLSAASAGLVTAAYQTYVANFGAETPHILLGGPANDTFTGGAAADFLYGSAGTNTLTGGSGGDTFLFTGNSTDVDIITDFDAAQGDAIDLAGVLNGTSKLLTDYVRIRRNGSDALVEISALGTNAGFADRVIRLKNSTLQPEDLLSLYYNGNLETGAIGLPPRVSLVATTPLASENGPVTGRFTVSREGSLDLPLPVNLQISGNATNGVDYQNIASSVTIPAGQASAVVSIMPYVDSTVELNEVVNLELLASTSYLLGTARTASLTIEDLKPQLSLELLEGIAGVSDGTPGAVLIRRSGLLSTDVFLQLTLSGTAKNGIDYNNVSTFQSLAAGQTTKLIEFTPKPTVNFGSAEAKTIRMTVKPDATFALMAPTADLLLVPERLTYDAWLAAGESSAQAAPLDGQAASDPKLTHYAFGQNPQDRVLNTAALNRMPKATIENGYLTLRFRRKPGITDMHYRIEYSSDFTNWQSDASVVEDITSQVSPNDPAAMVFRSKKPMSAEKAAAMRVKLLRNSDSN